MRNKRLPEKIYYKDVNSILFNFIEWFQEYFDNASWYDEDDLDTPYIIISLEVLNHDSWTLEKLESWMKRLYKNIVVIFLKEEMRHLGKEEKDIRKSNTWT